IKVEDILFLVPAMGVAPQDNLSRVRDYCINLTMASQNLTLLTQTRHNLSGDLAQKSSALNMRCDFFVIFLTCTGRFL
ncbi:MAG TPA: hypothetical protein VEI53_02100, partial [Ktedonobacteraceae bacterium]|nr:hypothetical protein [Ktedonobacteraceae bacterium]